MFSGFPTCRSEKLTKKLWIGCLRGISKLLQAACTWRQLMDITLDSVLGSFCDFVVTEDSSVYIVVACFLELPKQRQKQFRFERLDLQLYSDRLIFYPLNTYREMSWYAPISKLFVTARELLCVPVGSLHKWSDRWKMYREEYRLQDLGILPTW